MHLLSYQFLTIDWEGGNKKQMCVWTNSVCRRLGNGGCGRFCTYVIGCCVNASGSSLGGGMYTSVELLLLCAVHASVESSNNSAICSVSVLYLVCSAPSAASSSSVCTHDIGWYDAGFLEYFHVRAKGKINWSVAYWFSGIIHGRLYIFQG